MPESWPTKKVDQSLDTIDSIDYKRIVLKIFSNYVHLRLTQF